MSYHKENRKIIVCNDIIRSIDRSIRYKFNIYSKLNFFSIYYRLLLWMMDQWWTNYSIYEIVENRLFYFILFFCHFCLIFLSFTNYWNNNYYYHQIIDHQLIMNVHVLIMDWKKVLYFKPCDGEKEKRRGKKNVHLYYM